jgi:dolichol kinase
MLLLLFSVYIGTYIVSTVNGTQVVAMDRVTDGADHILSHSHGQHTIVIGGAGRDLIRVIDASYSVIAGDGAAFDYDFSSMPTPTLSSFTSGSDNNHDDSITLITATHGEAFIVGGEGHDDITTVGISGIICGDSCSGILFTYCCRH